MMRANGMKIWKAGVAFRVVSLLALAAFASSVRADDVPKLLVAKRCNACHEVDTMLIGPPYIAIATRHSLNKEAMVEVLARKIVLGGGGNWGVVPMVPNEHVTLEEARAMAKWILELKPPQS